MKNSINKRKRLIIFIIFLGCSILSFGASYPSGTYISPSSSASSSQGSGGIAQPPPVQPLLGDTGMVDPGDPGAVPNGDSFLPLVGCVLLYGLYKKSRKKIYVSN